MEYLSTRWMPTVGGYIKDGKPEKIREPVRASGGELTVALSNGRRIEVNRGFDGDTLKRLVGLLEQA